MSTAGLVEHFFRHQYGKLVATLARRVGVQHIEAVEDAAQSALMSALESWTRAGVPDRPEAWLFRVAHNRLVDELRTKASRDRILRERATGGDDSPPVDTDHYLAEEVHDDLLRMLFVCCDDSIPIESQLVTALKVLCGFGVREISLRLFTTEANVYKRLGRARARLRGGSLRFEDLSPEACEARVPAVNQTLYLMFTEGYLSSHGERAIRRELCDEAIRLATLLAEHELGRRPECRALVALMHLHAARMGAREDGSGGLLLLEEQDRSLWDMRSIQRGLWWLERSAEGERFSRYHAEAGIAAEHCLAPTFAETRWDRVAECYALLESGAQSSIHRLNRAVALAEWKGPAEGLALLEGFEPPTWLAGSYLWSAVLSDLHRRCGNRDKAARFREAALRGAPTGAIRDLMRRRLSSDDV